MQLWKIIFRPLNRRIERRRGMAWNRRLILNASLFAKPRQLRY